MRHWPKGCELVDQAGLLVVAQRRWRHCGVVVLVKPVDIAPVSKRRPVYCSGVFERHSIEINIEKSLCTVAKEEEERKRC